MKNYLMFDIGTGNSRAALVRSDGEIIGISSFANKYYRDDAYEDAQYFVPSEWKERLLAGAQELCDAHPEIHVDAVSAAAARQSFVLINRQGNAFMGLPNIDNRGRSYMSEINPKGIYGKTGKWVTEDFGAAKLLGYRKMYPDESAGIRWFVSVSEWIGYFLTGNICMEYSHASETQLYNLTEKEWDADICRAYGIDPEILPPLKASGDVLGKIDEKYIEQLHMSEDAVFITGGADTQTAIRQTGIQTGDIAIVSGTTSPVVALTDHRITDEKERVWVDADLGGDRFQIEMNPGVTGMNYQKMKDHFCPDITYDQLEKYYVEKGRINCTASFTSLLFYEKRGMKHGGFFMRSPLQDDVRREDLMFAVLGDIACGIYEELRRLMDISGSYPEKILGCGGGFQSDTLRRMVASLCGRPLVLRKGYEQATVEGLVNICNKTMQEADIIEDEKMEAEPGDQDVIHEYYRIWMHNREILIHSDFE